MTIFTPIPTTNR
ncbi:uncharacterized protein CELE_F08C6.18 [Caenorhabditis elegans]|uniref:Uncharacterized protein n=1 Tax=Caenorhabditis elegans TaxID=6239 RepID=A0A2K5AU10_CAEEL|nr:Uncharacterized protein CELE_F08C6.18 [Caenorhabditis elegans]SPC48664.2 Uncharacterized protein CELE_F08C6.18 [Caenorhabditis elegans]|eukprot:NP_001348803.2 Uncharacterized protein CELE_F08C6.18 [Caenorhabditis elegans]